MMAIDCVLYIRKILVTIGLLYLSAATVMMANETSPAELTSAEAIGYACLHPQFPTPPLGVLRGADPRATPGLWHLLNNPQLSTFHARALMVLGNVGAKDDVPKLQEWIGKHFTGELEDLQAHNLSMSLVALGLMFGRDIEAAGEALQAMSKRAYWRDSNIRWSAGDAITTLDPVEETLVRVVQGSWYSGRQDLFDESDLARLDDPKAKEEVDWRLSDRTFARIKEAVTAGVAPADVETRQRLLLSFTGDIDTPRPRTLDDIAEMNRDAFQKPIIAQARQAFDQIVKTIEVERYEPLKHRLLFNLKPRKEEFANEHWVHIKEDLMQAKATLSLLGDIEVDTDRARVASRFHIPVGLETGVEQRIQHAVAEADVTVWIPLRNSQEAGVAHPFWLNRACDTFDEDGGLIVVMRRIDGEWYWNPFGWEAR
jgi:hypothetical protein